MDISPGVSNNILEIKIQMARIEERTINIQKGLEDLPCNRNLAKISYNALEIERTKRLIYITFFSLFSCISGIILLTLKITDVI